MTRSAVAAGSRVALLAVVLIPLVEPQLHGVRQEGKPASSPASSKPSPVAPPQRPVVPVAASTLIACPEPFYGEPVSLAAIVDANLSRTAFSVDHDRHTSGGQGVLVIAPTLQRSPEVNTYVTVIGELARFDPAALASKLGVERLELPADAATRFAGKPVVIAASVVDRAGVDMARRLPPPMTADEQALQKLMKAAGGAQGTLRKAIDGSDAKLSAEQAVILRTTFVDVEAFWRKRRQADAARFSAEARKQAEAVERAAMAARWDDVKSAAGTLTEACQKCHEAHRERFDDGSFRIRKSGAR